MIIFPEGTRRSCEELLPFKKGAFYMSVNSGMRILPVVIQKYPFLDYERKVFGRGEVKVNILKPMERFENETLDAFTMRVYTMMNAEYQQLNKT